MFYEVLMEKKAEANYHSRYLSERQRNAAFDQANTRRAGRETGKSTSRNAGGVAGAVIGGLGGGLIGGTKGALVSGGAGALVGGGLGYLRDNARDSRTREARDILKMSPKERRSLLDTKRARKLEQEDRARRLEERAHREAIRTELREALSGRRQNA